MTNTFSFDYSDEHHRYKISSNIVLHLCRETHSHALLYVTDESEDVISLPDELIVWAKEFQNKNIIQMQHANGYVLCWTNDYTIEFNGKVVLEITNKRVWDIVVC